jgi:hypothetical protein
MLVCIVHGAPVLISRREKPNLVVRDLFAPLNSLEKYRNRCLCPQSKGVLQPGEIRTWWPAKSVGNLGWRAYDFSRTWARPLECCIASNINSEVKARKKVLETDLSTVLSWKSRCQSISASTCDFSGS